jgi:hypothetical protein
MKNPFIVRPTGLKGNEKLNRMRELMGGAPLNEDVKNSVVELTKLGPDGKVYGIVREGHNYFIKITNKTSNILTEDFNYIGGLMNKTSEAYPSYAKAIKQLNLKFMSLNEALGKSGNFNVFEDDNLLTEHHPYKSDQKLSATKGMGDASEYIVDKSGKELSYDAKEGKEKDGFGDNLATKDVEDEFEKVKLSENEMAIENMLNSDEDEMPEGSSDEEEKAALVYEEENNPWAICTTSVGREDKDKFERCVKDVKAKNKLKESKKGFSIESALTKMDSIIGEETTDKVTEILNSLTESEKSTLLNTLKKKV